MSAYVHGGEPLSRPVLDFSVSVNPMGPPQSVLDAARESIARIGSYPDPEQKQLKEKLAGALGLPNGEIVLGNGSAELIDLYVRALHPKNAAILIPSFWEYERALRAGGCRIRHVRLKEENGFMPGQEELSELIRYPKTDLIMISNPQNPTGKLLPGTFLLELAAECSVRKIHLFIDESFIQLTDDPVSYTAIPLLQKERWIFLLNSFTKQFAMPGLRLGCGLTSDTDLIDKMEMNVQPWNISVPASAAGMAAIDELDYLKKSRTLIRKERKKLEDNLRELGFSVLDSDTNFILFKGRTHLKEKLIDKGILIRDCSNFRGLCDGYYRVCVRMPDENRILIEALRNVINEES